MNWVNAEWLWSIPVWLLLGHITWLLLKRQSERLEAYIPRNFWGRLAPGLSLAARRFKLALVTLAVSFVAIALARPQKGLREEELKLSGIDVVFVLDVSNSMLVEDVAPSRLQRMLQLVQAVIDRSAGDRFGIVAFAGNAYPVSPLTQDAEFLKETLQSVHPRMIQSQGTDISIGLESAAKLLERGGVSTGVVGDASGRAVILVSDGEELESQAVEAAESLKKVGVKLIVVGVGTSEGGPIPQRNESGQLLGYKRDSSGKPVVSRFTGKALEELTGQLQGKLIQLNDLSQAVDLLTGELRAVRPNESGVKRVQVFEELFQFPLSIALLLLIAELSIAEVRRRRVS